VGRQIFAAAGRKFGPAENKFGGLKIHRHEKIRRLPYYV
jgi:hypothetical protein